jgi:hypothetical protein
MGLHLLALFGPVRRGGSNSGLGNQNDTISLRIQQRLHPAYLSEMEAIWSRFRRRGKSPEL